MRLRFASALQAGLMTLFPAASALAQQPVVGAAVNSASYISPGLPGSELAQGSIISVFGTNMGPATLQTSNGFPLQTTLAGTSAQVTVNGTTVDLPMFYTSASQLAAILPSKTPIGTGTITVTYNGQTSATSPITVVQSAFGVYSIPGTGGGPAVATFADYTVIGPTHPAHNGDQIVIWGTGLGPIATDDGGAAAPGNLNVNLQAFVGGLASTVTYHGRSGCCAGLDQVVLTVPQNVSGCTVPVSFQIGDEVGNYTSIAVAAPGQNSCTDPVTNLGGSTLANLYAKGTVSVGDIALSHTTSNISGVLTGSGTQTMDDAFASFSKITIGATSPSLTSIFSSSVSLGACTVYTINSKNVSTTPDNGFTSVSLDAGPSIALTGPTGTQTLAKNTFSNFIEYSASGTTGLPANFITGGNFTAVGTGGVDVGAFNASLTLPPLIDWTNQSSITSIDRATGQLITWSGGDPNGTVTISGSADLVAADFSSITTFFTCIVPTSAGSFTIPSNVLLSLPPSTPAAGSTFTSGPGVLEVLGYSQYNTFTAPGLDLGLFFGYTGAFSTVTYQ